MGMDVSGKKPTSEAGKYFRNNCWWWRPLADYCCEVAPELTAKCTYWQTNDGDGLNGKDSKTLAAVLRAEIAAGRTEAYASIRDVEHNMMPDESCIYCNGTGVRIDAVGIANGMHLKAIPDDAENHPRVGATGWCNGCDGKGRKRPADTWYHFSVENVKEFADFLDDCGGFKIW